MSDNNVSLVSDLKNKINKILSLYEKVKSENADLKKENDALLEDIKKKKHYIEDIEQKYENLKMARAMEISEGDSEEAKVKIKRIVREIDKCIALLNK